MRTLTTALMTSAAMLASVSVASAQTATTPAPAATTPAATATNTAAVEPRITPLSEWNPAITAETSMSVEEILDMDVYDTTGEEIGEVENVLFGADGKVLSVIAEVGGLWDIGDTHVNVPWKEVDVDPVAERVVLPLTEEILEDYTLFKNEVVTASAAATAVQEVSGDGAGLVETAPRVWQARELMDDYARLRDGDTFVNYGYVDDLIIQNGQVSAVIVRPDVGYGARGSYAYPFYGYNYGWRPGETTYDLPYTRADVAGLQPYDDDILDD